jgi:hypothetical protein
VALPPVTIAAGELLQHVSRCAYRGTSLYFGRDATNRYDSPDRGYGVLYPVDVDQTAVVSEH